MPENETDVDPSDKLWIEELKRLLSTLDTVEVDSRGRVTKLEKLGRKASTLSLPDGATTEERGDFDLTMNVLRQGLQATPTETTVDLTESRLALLEEKIRRVEKRIVEDRAKKLSQLAEKAKALVLPSDASTDEKSSFDTTLDVLVKAVDPAPSEIKLQLAEQWFEELEKAVSDAEKRLRPLRVKRLKEVGQKVATLKLADGGTKEEQEAYAVAVQVLNQGLLADPTDTTLELTEARLLVLEKRASAPQDRRDAEKGLEAARAKYAKTRKAVRDFVYDARADLPATIGSDLKSAIDTIDLAESKATTAKAVQDEEAKLAPVKDRAEAALGFYRLWEEIKLKKQEFLDLAGNSEKVRLVKILSDAEVLANAKKWSGATAKAKTFIDDPKTGKVKAFYAALDSFRSDLATEMRFFGRLKPNKFPTHYKPLVKLDAAKNIALSQNPPTGTDYDNAVVAINGLRTPFQELYAYLSVKGKYGSLESKTTDSSKVQQELNKAQTEANKANPNFTTAMSFLRATPFQNLIKGPYEVSELERKVKPYIDALRKLDNTTKACTDNSTAFSAGQLDRSNKRWSDAKSKFNAVKPLAEAALKYLERKVEFQRALAAAPTDGRPDLLAPIVLKENAKKYDEAYALLPAAEDKLAAFVQYATARARVTELRKLAKDVGERTTIDGLLKAAKDAADLGSYIVGRDILDTLTVSETFGERAKALDAILKRQAELKKRRSKLHPTLGLTEVQTLLSSEETAVQTELTAKKLPEAKDALDALEGHLKAAAGWNRERAGVIGLLDGLAKTKTLGLHNYDPPGVTAVKLTKNQTDGDTKAKAAKFPESLVEYGKARTAADALTKTIATQMDSNHGGHSVEKHGPSVTDLDRKKRVTDGIPTPKTRFSSSFKSGSAWMQAYSAAVKKIIADGGPNVTTASSEVKNSYSFTIEHGQEIGTSMCGFEEKLQKGTKTGERGEPISSTTYNRVVEVGGLTRSTHVFRWDNTNSRYFLLTQYPSTKNFDFDLGVYTTPL